MTVRVVGASGVPVTAATLDDISGDAYVLPPATTAAIGGVKKMASQTDSSATDVAGLLADFNAFLAKARTAGMM